MTTADERAAEDRCRLVEEHGIEGGDPNGLEQTTAR
jgi:hypothetical protein